jgi:hypothetical protein
MWNFNLAHICKQYEFVVFDTSGLSAPTHNKLDAEQRKNNIKLFTDELESQKNWNVPHAVHDEMLRRSLEDNDLGVLVELLNSRLVSFGRSKITSGVRKKSIEYANKYSVAEYDRVSMALALSYVILTNERSALISNNSCNSAAFRELRFEAGISEDKSAVYVFSKGVYRPLLEHIKVN